MALILCPIYAVWPRNVGSSEAPDVGGIKRNVARGIGAVPTKFHGGRALHVR